MTTPEDRLAAALNERASAARTSPDALDTVFRRVTTHRRRTRAMAGAGLALAIVAGTVVATDAAKPKRNVLDPANGGQRPTPSSSSSAPAPPPVVPRKTATPSPTPVDDPAETAVVRLPDRRVVVVSTRTGRRLQVLGRLPSDATGTKLAWSGDTVYFERPGCRIGVLDPKGTRDVATGFDPDLSPDGKRLATTSCSDPAMTGGKVGRGVTVTDLASGAVKEYPGLTQEPKYGESPPASAWDLTWLDATRIAVTVWYEYPEGLVVLDTANDRTLDDGKRINNISASSLASRGSTYLALQPCCGGEQTGRPETLARWTTNGVVTNLMTSRHGATLVDIDRSGRVLLLGGEGLWRWDGKGAEVLVQRGALALGT